ncbi:FAD-dependent oxidoreductase [Telluria aromaticivorans]|uniref:FAD-dependent monooxygenase n=1 Tax=Telluria aromaticivorans TaxID=2725995 RepID=A0A7Y2JVP2_9BURK|nr:NAD(P)/FAD-dependent oxidoreductase [Telluria aromaticivorans]NNG21771.1 FAD-dependent monooxygenase [Telluria aromaticivorans]
MLRSNLKGCRVGIVGAGSAGLATAIAMARDGHEVGVFEKHPSLATLGAGVLIQPQGIAALEDLGVAQAFEAASVPIERLVGLSHRGWKLVDIDYRGQEARAVSRSALGRVLQRECLRLGASLHFGADVTGVRSEGERGIIDVNGAPREFDIVVIANGATSSLSAQCSLATASTPYAWGALWSLIDLPDWQAPTQLLQRYGGTRRMFGIMPTERLPHALRVSVFWSLHRDKYTAWRAAPIEDFKRELLALWPESGSLVERIHSHEQFAFAAYCHARPKRLAAGPIAIVGDAAHAMSPQLGMGTTLAVQDALALATKVAQHGPAVGLERYSAGRLRTVRAYQALSRALTPCFQFEANGWWRDLAFAGSLYLPGTRYLMHRSIAAPRRCARAAWAA